MFLLAESPPPFLRQVAAFSAIDSIMRIQIRFICTFKDSTQYHLVPASTDGRCMLWAIMLNSTCFILGTMAISTAVLLFFTFRPDSFFLLPALIPTLDLSFLKIKSIFESVLEKARCLFWAMYTRRKLTS